MAAERTIEFAKQAMQQVGVAAATEAPELFTNGNGADGLLDCVVTITDRSSGATLFARGFTFTTREQV